MTDELNEISYKIIGCAYEVHNELGPGLLEKTYEVCLIHELLKVGLEVKQQVALPVLYKGIRLDAGYRIDLLVDNQIILELKSVEALAPIHQAQLLTYMRLADIRLGLLFNFNVLNMRKGGIKRMVL